MAHCAFHFSLYTSSSHRMRRNLEFCGWDPCLAYLTCRSLQKGHQYLSVVHGASPFAHACRSDRSGPPYRANSSISLKHLGERSMAEKWPVVWVGCRLFFSLARACRVRGRCSQRCDGGSEPG